MGRERKPGIAHLSFSRTSSHCLLWQCQGHFFRLELQAPDGSFLRLSELQHQLREIKRQARTCGDVAVPVGWLTALPRQKWAEARKKIVAESGKNAAVLEVM